MLGDDREQVAEQPALGLLSASCWPILRGRMRCGPARPAVGTLGQVDWGRYQARRRRPAAPSAEVASDLGVAIAYKGRRPEGSRGQVRLLRGPSGAGAGRLAARSPRSRPADVAQHQARLADAAPLVDLERERRFGGHALGDRQPRAGAERDRPRPSAPRLDREAHVLAFAHRPRVARTCASATISDTAGLPRPNGASACSSSASSIPSSLAARRPRRRAPAAADPRAAGPALRARRTPRRTPPRARARSPGPRRRDGRRGAAGARRRRRGPPAGRTPSMLRPEPPAPLAVQRDQHDRAVVALGQARGDDPDHAGVPALAGEHVCRALARARRSALRPRSGSASRPRGARGWRGRAPSAICAARARVLGQDQLEAGVRTVDAPRGVQPRRQREADRALVDLRRDRTRATSISARSPGFAVAASARSPRRTSARFSPTAARRRRSSPAPPGRGPARARAGSRPAPRRTAPARACRRPRSRTARRRDSRRRAGCTIGARGSAPSARGAWWSLTTTSHPQRARQLDLLDCGDRAVGREQQARARAAARRRTVVAPARSRRPRGRAGTSRRRRPARAARARAPPSSRRRRRRSRRAP